MTTDRGSMADFTAAVDASRPSENLFVGIRADGPVRETGAAGGVCRRTGGGAGRGDRPPERIHGWRRGGVPGRVLGAALCPSGRRPGYHFHFISEDRTFGGHLLDMEAGQLEVGIHIESDLHIAIPETEEFLTADLSGDHHDALHQAETAGSKCGQLGPAKPDAATRDHDLPIHETSFKTSAARNDRLLVPSESPRKPARHDGQIAKEGRSSARSARPISETNSHSWAAFGPREVEKQCEMM